MTVARPAAPTTSGTVRMVTPVTATPTNVVQRPVSVTTAPTRVVTVRDPLTSSQLVSKQCLHLAALDQLDPDELFSTINVHTPKQSNLYVHKKCSVAD